MKIVLADVNAADLAAAEAAMRAAGATVIGARTDVSKAEDVEALAARTLEAFGAVHLVVNNAGVAPLGNVWENTVADWQWTLGVNLWGVIHGVRAFVPLLMQQTEAYIVNTASVAGLVAAPFMGPYNASKHAVVAISETLHHELAMSAPQVKVSVLCPGWVNTKIAESARNRPEHLKDGAAPDADAAALLRGFLEQGMPPDEVAAKVLDAMREERFWILTHDEEGDFWVDGVNRRLRSLETRTNPRLGLPL
jgi:NAD(P)-dependent dehydrogenase (short-subunit alcohol dehydrogenase family)